MVFSLGRKVLLIIVFPLGVLFLLDVLGLDGLGVCIVIVLLFLILSFRMIIKGSSGRVSTINLTCISSSTASDSIRSCLARGISSSILSDFEWGSCILGRYSY